MASRPDVPSARGRAGPRAPRGLAAAAAALVALAPGAAGGQAFDGTQRVDTFTGPLASPGRILGLGGAYVAVAEGLGASGAGLTVRVHEGV